MIIIIYNLDNVKKTTIDINYTKVLLFLYVI